MNELKCNTNQKNDSLLKLVKRLKYSQAIVYSDEGNLDDMDDFVEPIQPLDWRNKPRGLWFSLGKAWVEWLNDPLESETWRRKRLSWITHVYQIYLSKSVLIIDTPDKFEAFEKKYASKSKEVVNWGRVSKHHSGILIVYNERGEDGDSYWYWSWDVSGGCIWKRDGIVRTRRIAAWEPTWKRA